MADLLPPILPLARAAASLMNELEYTVRERVDGSVISWEAVEAGSGAVIPLTVGGYQSATLNSVGAYPEIEAHLAGAHGIQTSLKFRTGVDQTNHRGDGITWIYNRQGGALRVFVHDITRTVLRLTPV